MDYETYQTLIIDDVKRVLEEKRFQPVLFIGSGLSRRYMGLPDWNGLLEEVAKACPTIDREYPYYIQTFTHPIFIASHFAEKFHEWAWGLGRKQFPDYLFSAGYPKDIFLKFEICRYIETRSNSFEITKLSDEFQAEINSLRLVQPHAIVTTNYDILTELIFPRHEPVIGQQIIRSTEITSGEIFKIHGSVSNIASLVLDKSDYDEFNTRKKYLSAKLLTLFTEHPLIFIGYRADDPNIKAILSDIDEILAPAGSLIPNIYFLQWDTHACNRPDNPFERLIPIDEHKSVRIKNIAADDFTWVFDVFGSDTALGLVDPRMLRSLLAHTYDVVRSDLPKRRVDVDFAVLEAAASSKEGMLKVLGVGDIGTAPDVNFTHPYFITQIANDLGYGKNFNAIRRFMAQVKEEKGFDMEATDNRYRVAIKTGKSSKTGKYSQEAVDLFERLKSGETYEISL